MRTHIFQHVPFEGPGNIYPWLVDHHSSIETTHVYQNTPLPSLESFDVLIVMGGPMSVKDEAQYPWLRAEKAFIREAISAGKSILGICLGAQLIAASLGTEVKANPIKEIGWFPIHGNEYHAGFLFPEELTVFHWHGESFELPPDAMLLASSPDCKHQAFQLSGKKVIGIQFHLETNAESLKAIIEHCRHELEPGAKIMPESEMLKKAPQYFEKIHHQMNRLLLYLTSDI
ncbi:type 1 glutamine amidotransferase [Kiritimatiellota bacterium B12222]|nr:type 1 glutamine amidotransferase [Kiritimatiellota bacterium B12222]